MTVAVLRVLQPAAPGMVNSLIGRPQSHDPNPVLLTDRIQECEVRITRLQLLLTVLVGSIIAIFGIRNSGAGDRERSLMSKDRVEIPNVVQARSFEVLDKNGRVRVRLSVDDELASVSIMGAKGNKHVDLSETGLLMLDHRDEKRMHLGFVQKGSAPRDDIRLTLFGADGSKPLVIQSDWFDEPSIFLADKQNRDRVRVSVSGNTPSIEVLRQDGSVAWKSP